MLSVSDPSNTHGPTERSSSGPQTSAVELRVHMEASVSFPLLTLIHVVECLHAANQTCEA